jgi:hypothetical protein
MLIKDGLINMKERLFSINLLLSDICEDFFKCTQVFLFALFQLEMNDFHQFITKLKPKKGEEVILTEDHKRNLCHAMYQLIKQNFNVDEKFLLQYDFKILDNECLIKKYLLNGGVLYIASERLRNKNSIARLFAFKSWFLTERQKEWLAINFRYLSETQKSNPVYLRSVIPYDGSYLEYASDELKKDFNLVESAIRKNPWVFKFALDEYRNDIVNINKHFKFVDLFFHSLPEQLKSDTNFMLKCIHSKFYMIFYVNHEFIFDHFDSILNETTFLPFVQYLGQHQFSNNHYFGEPISILDKNSPKNENISHFKDNLIYMFSLLATNKKRINEQKFMSIIKDFHIAPNNVYGLMATLKAWEKESRKDAGRSQTFKDLVFNIIKTFSDSFLDEIENIMIHQWKLNSSIKVNGYDVFLEKLESLFFNERHRRCVESINRSTTKEVQFKQKKTRKINFKELKAINERICLTDMTECSV